MQRNHTPYVLVSQIIIANTVKKLRVYKILLDTPFTSEKYGVSTTYDKCILIITLKIFFSFEYSVHVAVILDDL